jgi:hypothetical protein
VPAHKDLGIVLVEGALVVSYSRHILDDDAVIRMLTRLVKLRVRSNHVIHDIRLGDLLRTELLLGAQVFAVVVAEVVVARNRGELDTSVDEEVDKGRFHLGLAGLEVIAADESVVLLGELDGARDEGVLRRTVDERSALKDTGNGKDGGWRNLFVAALNSFKQVLGSVVDA